MNYQKHYNLLIERAKNRVLEGYSEKHHIIPRCMGGSNKKENLVRLTPEEHYVAHQLLVKIYPGNHKLVYAANMMSVESNTNKRIKNKKYGWLKRRMATALSLLHFGRDPWNKGKVGVQIVSKETKRKQSLSQKGKRKVKWSEERKAKKSEAMKGKIPWNKGKKGLQKAWNKGQTLEELFGAEKGAELRQKNKFRRKGKSYKEQYGEVVAEELRKRASDRMQGKKNHFFGKKHSEETIQKLRKPKSEEHKQKLRLAALTRKRGTL